MLNFKDLQDILSWIDFWALNGLFLHIHVPGLETLQCSFGDHAYGRCPVGQRSSLLSSRLQTGAGFLFELPCICIHVIFIPDQYHSLMLTRGMCRALYFTVETVYSGWWTVFVFWQMLRFVPSLKSYNPYLRSYARHCIYTCIRIKSSLPDLNCNKCPPRRRKRKYFFEAS